MIVQNIKYSKWSPFASIVSLIVFGFIFFSAMGYAKEEKDEQQTLSTANVDKDNIIINVTEKGEILIQGDKIELDSIQRRVEDYRNEHPGGNVIITCDEGPPCKKARDVFDIVRAAKVKNVVVAVKKDKKIYGVIKNNQ